MYKRQNEGYPAEYIKRNIYLKNSDPFNLYSISKGKVISTFSATAEIFVLVFLSGIQARSLKLCVITFIKPNMCTGCGSLKPLLGSRNLRGVVGSCVLNDCESIEHLPFLF